MGNLKTGQELYANLQHSIPQEFKNKEALVLCYYEKYTQLETYPIIQKTTENQIIINLKKPSFISPHAFFMNDDTIKIFHDFEYKKREVREGTILLLPNGSSFITTHHNTLGKVYKEIIFTNEKETYTPIFKDYPLKKNQNIFEHKSLIKK